MEFVATCVFGLESLLGKDIDALGYQRTETIDGRVKFEADVSAVARCNINFRYAERLYLNVGSFHAETFDELFEGAYALPWDSFIPREAEFPVKGHSVKSRLFSLPDCQRILKKAISKKLGSAYGLSVLPETGPRYQVEFFLLKDHVDLMIDVSGVALHKRGYRPEQVAAPLRETLAAALAAVSRPRDNVLLWDPFCGSGTIAIEAAMLMKNIAPGLHRSFSSEQYEWVPRACWDNAREEACSCERHGIPFEAYASDIDENCVALAQKCAERAGVGDVVKCFRMDALSIEKPEGRRGTIVTNPPYGERLLTAEDAEHLYREMGIAFQRLSPWQLYILTPNERFQLLFGRKADKVRKLYNGMIPCYYYQFFKSNR